MKKVLMAAAGVVVVALVCAAAFVALQVKAFDDSMMKVYDIAVPAIQASQDPDVLARGEHLARGMASCATADCHGANLAGGKTIDMGPVGLISAPNITAGGILADYTDGELARLIQHGIKRDGRSTILMPMQEMNWLPESDVAAIVAWVRAQPAVTKETGPLSIGVLGKVLDRADALHLDVARRIDHDNLPVAPPPSPTAEYGAFIARGCQGCHGQHLSGGPLPGSPPGMAVPTNLTPHETGLARWTYEDFLNTLQTGTRPDGTRLDPLMPFEALSRMNDTEKAALWAYLRSVEPRPSGGR